MVVDSLSLVPLGLDRARIDSLMRCFSRTSPSGIARVDMLVRCPIWLKPPLRLEHTLFAPTLPSQGFGVFLAFDAGSSPPPHRLPGVGSQGASARGVISASSFGTL